MADDNNPFDDEFHFSDDEDAGMFDDDPSSTIVREGDNDSNMKRNIMLAVGGVLLLLAVYKFLGAYLGSKSKSDAGALPTVSQMTPQAPTVSPPSSVKTVSRPTVPSYSPPVTRRYTPPVNSSSDSGLNQRVVNKLDLLEQGLSSSQSDIGNIGNNLDGLKNRLTGLTNTIEQLNKSIAMLTREVRQQQDQIAEIKHKRKAKPRRVARKSRAKKTAYYIQAIIPGRAWLKTSKGSTITVSEGTAVSGHGRVKIIDPHQQEVVMSSGEVIRFSPSDT